MEKFWDLAESGGELIHNKRLQYKKQTFNFWLSVFWILSIIEESVNVLGITVLVNSLPSGKLDYQSVGDK